MGEPEALPKKQRALADTALGLFRRYGLRRVTIEEVCREAGVSKATFYKYFDNKVALVAHLLRELADDVFRRLEAIEAMDAPFAEKVRLVVEDRIERTRGASDAFIADVYHLDDALGAELDRLAARNTRRFFEFLERGQRQGHVRPELRLEFALAALAKLNELVTDDAVRRLYPDYADMARELGDFFFYGLLTRANPVGELTDSAARS
jgi:AcrR family transcriptional regulator